MCFARKYLFAAGGTGGHVFPAIAIADELRRIDPTAEILFMGDPNRIEAKSVPAAGYAWEAIKTVTVHRPIVSPQNVWNFMRLVNAIWSTFWRVRRYEPDVVLGTGGYIAFPTCVAAGLLGRPFYLHEANVIPGLVNRMLCGFSRGVFTAFAIPAKYISSFTCKPFGNPIRRQFTNVDRDTARRTLGIRDDQLLLTIVGGSLGAEAVNTVMREILPALLQALPKLVVHHQVGLAAAHDALSPSASAAAPEAATETGPSQDSRYRELVFIDDMASQLFASDLVVSRSGAITCSELLATGAPSILIPLPASADNHQFYNAVSMDAIGAAVLVKQDQEGVSDLLASKVQELLGAPAVLAEMRSAAKGNGQLDAAHNIALALYQTACDPKVLPDVLRQFFQRGDEDSGDEESDVQTRKPRKRKPADRKKAEGGSAVAQPSASGPPLSPAS